MFEMADELEGVYRSLSKHLIFLKMQSLNGYLNAV